MNSESCDISNGDTQCPFWTDVGGGYLFCALRANHTGPHLDAYQAANDSPGDAGRKWIGPPNDELRRMSARPNYLQVFRAKE